MRPCRRPCAGLICQTSFSMFGLFKSIPYHDPKLGVLKRSRGMWRGTIQLASQPVELALSGTRRGPDPKALAAACDAPGLMHGWRPIIEQALFEHYQPSLDAWRRGKFDTVGAPFPLISSPAGVWDHVRLMFLVAAPIGGVMMTELGYDTAWDTEHTVGARFAGSEFIELNGSVGAP